VDHGGQASDIKPVMQGLSAARISHARHDAFRAMGLFLDHQRPDGADKIRLGGPMLDKRDYLLRPRGRIVEARVVAISAQKQPHCCKGGALVSLLEGMSLGYRGQKSHREHDDIFLAIGESILWTAQCAFEQANVAEEVPFPGFLDL